MNAITMLIISECEGRSRRMIYARRATTKGARFYNSITSPTSRYYREAASSNKEGVVIRPCTAIMLASDCVTESMPE